MQICAKVISILLHQACVLQRLHFPSTRHCDSRSSKQTRSKEVKETRDSNANVILNSKCPLLCQVARQTPRPLNRVQWTSCSTSRVRHTIVRRLQAPGVNVLVKIRGVPVHFVREYCKNSEVRQTFVLECWKCRGVLASFVQERWTKKIRNPSKGNLTQHLRKSIEEAWGTHWDMASDLRMLTI